jgi:uncharacterized membrane protein YfcA
MDLLVIILIAFLVSVLFSILGLGGAIIYTPLFFWLGVPLLTAIPMALLLNAITTASASITYFRQHIVDLKIGPPIIFTSILGTIVGSYMASRVDTKILVLMFSVILVIAALRLLFFNTIKSSINGTEKYLIGTVGGFLIGVISSLLGIGGGTFVVPMLMVLGLKTKNAVATSAFIVTFMSFSGFLGHFGFGQLQLDLNFVVFAGIAVFIGAQAGSILFFKRTSSRTIEKMFAVVLLIIALKLLTS